MLKTPGRDARVVVFSVLAPAPVVGRRRHGPDHLASDLVHTHLAGGGVAQAGPDTWSKACSNP
jgi:hypothetical protein